MIAVFAVEWRAVRRDLDKAKQILSREVNNSRDQMNEIAVMVGRKMLALESNDERLKQELLLSKNNLKKTASEFHIRLFRPRSPLFLYV